MIGKTISHYKILERIGGGGMGIVYKAEDTKLDRTVALKFLPPAFATDLTTKERFIHEAKSASALQHSNICTIHEINESEDGQMYIVMDYYEGETLKQKLESGKIDIDTVIDYTIQIAKGLQKAHEKGIIHRDIKPANIMITTDSEVKILDFGLSKIKGKSKLTKTGSTVGTVAYMSPEQAKGEEIDHRTDIWSLGVMLYEMVTGELPFRGDYDQAIIYSIINTNPEPIQKHNKKIDSVFASMIHKTMKKNKNERHSSCSDFINDLQNLSGKDHALAFKKKARLDEYWENAKFKHKKRKSIFLGSLIVIIVLTVFYFWYFLERKPIKANTQHEEKRTATLVGDPMRIAVLPFTNLGAQKNLEKLLYDKMQVLFLDTVILNIMPWKIMDKFEVGNAIQGLIFDNSKFIDSKKAAEIGKTIGVDAIIIGSVTPSLQDAVNVDIRVIESEDAQILAARDVNLESFTEEDINDMVMNLLLKVINSIPHVEGNISGIGDFLQLDAGINEGLVAGRKCLIFRKGEPIKHPETGDILGHRTQIIAEIIVDKTFSKTSFFKILSKSDEDSIIIGDNFVTK